MVTLERFEEIDSAGMDGRRWRVVFTYKGVAGATVVTLADTGEHTTPGGSAGLDRPLTDEERREGGRRAIERHITAGHMPDESSEVRVTAFDLFDAAGAS